MMPLVVLLCGLLATAWAWYGLRASQQAAAELHTSAAHWRGGEAVEKRMSNHRQILLGGAGLFEASESVSREDWRHYVQRLDLETNYPGIQGVGFSRSSGLASWQNLRLLCAAVSDFSVRPPGSRDLYTSILFLEPFSGRNLAAGFDMYRTHA
jgi:CHASE1-domain containing sensor protein